MSAFRKQNYLIKKIDMKTIKNIILGLFLTIGITAFTQNTSGEIKGKVFELETGEALPFANVYVKKGERLIGTTTDFDGKFTLKPLDPGTYNLTISYVGMDTVLVKSLTVASEKITYIDDVHMASSMFGVVNVVWTPPVIDKGNPSIEHIGMKEIQNSALVRSPAAFLSASVGGVSQNTSGQIIIRGSRPGAVGYFVDGVKVRSLDGIPGRSIKGMSVYTGGVPAQYGDITSGVVIIETIGYFDLYNANKYR